MEMNDNIYIDTLGTLLLAYTMGMTEGTRPSDEVVYGKWKTLWKSVKLLMALQIT